MMHTQMYDEYYTTIQYTTTQYYTICLYYIIVHSKHDSICAICELEAPNFVIDIYFASWYHKVSPYKI